jgi:hypothetical protein
VLFVLHHDYCEKFPLAALLPAKVIKFRHSQSGIAGTALKKRRIHGAVQMLR